MLIKPHGGELIDLYNINFDKNLFKIYVNERIKLDIFNIGYGAYSPLTGFLGEKDFLSVLENGKLSNGILWPIPIVIDISNDIRKTIHNKGIKKALLVCESSNVILASISIEEIYKYDKKYFSKNLYNTLDINHPGVDKIFKMEEFLLAGPIELYTKFKHDIFGESYFLSPNDMRKKFTSLNFNNIVAFQTRNPPHRSHEYLQKCALEQADAILIHPVVGEKKIGDWNDFYIVGSYNILINKYCNKEKTFLSILPISMRYAGPKEAILHAIIRKNFGCNYMIIGRDHAGVGKFYGEYDAQNIFDSISQNELGIKILKYSNASFCEICRTVTSDKTCPHSNNMKIVISGTELRNCIKNNLPVSENFIRKEVLEFLKEGDSQFIV